MADAIVRMGRPPVIEVVGNKRAFTPLKARLIIPIVRIVEGVERPAWAWVTRFPDAACSQILTEKLSTAIGE